MEIVKIGALGLAGVMLALQFKSTRPEYSLYLGAAISLAVFAVSMEGMASITGRIRELEKYLAGSEGYLGFLFKAVGLTYICEFCASICRDAGYGAVAGQIEIFGKLSVLLMGLPVLTAVIENIYAIAG